VVHGLRRAGMHHCGKHFPGHGFVKADSHTEVPIDRRSLKAILADDAVPYAALSATLSSVMPAHVIYPKVDSRPAGFSSRWLRDILRGDMGFTGAIFSDDLTMEGARHLAGRSLSYVDAAATALQAGCDMVLMCNQSQVEGGRALDELLDGLWALQADGPPPGLVARHRPPDLGRTDARAAVSAGAELAERTGLTGLTGLFGLTGLTGRAPRPAAAVRAGRRLALQPTGAFNPGGRRLPSRTAVSTARGPCGSRPAPTDPRPPPRRACARAARARLRAVQRWPPGLPQSCQHPS